MNSWFHWDAKTTEQVLPITAFLICVLVTLLGSTALLTFIALESLRKRKLPKLSRFERVILILGGCGVLCILYGYLIEPYWLETKFVRLTSPKIHAVDKPLRIVQISDLHCDPQPRLENTLVSTIASLKPDLIVFTGDAINSPEGLPIFRKCLSSISPIAPTFVVKGNWDAWYFKDLDRFSGTGAIELKGDAHRINVRGDTLCVMGEAVADTKTVSEICRAAPTDSYKIFLFHYPDYIEDMQRNGIDLYLAGHTHGGQVALPFYGALITLSSRGKQYEAGLYHLNQTALYVNRGIGMEGGKAPRVRFCARPELTVFDLVAENKASSKHQ